MKPRHLPGLKSTSLLAIAAAITHTASAYPIEIPNWDFEVDRSDQAGDLAEGSDIYMIPLQQDWYQFDVNTNGGPQRYWNPGDINDPTAINVARFADTGFGGETPDHATGGRHCGIAITRYNDDKMPDGTNGSYIRDFEALAQVLEGVLFDPAEPYTLTVQVGHPPGDAGDPQHGAKIYAWNGYAVQLCAGGYEYDVGSSYAPCVYDGTVIAEDNNTVSIPVNTWQTVTVTYTPGDLTAQQEADLAGQPLQIRLCALEGPDHSVTSVVAFDMVTLDGPPPLETPVITAPTGGATDFDLQWTSYAGRVYNIFSSTDMNTWSPVVADIAATPPTNTYSVTPSGDTLFYRIEHAPAP